MAEFRQQALASTWRIPPAGVGLRGTNRGHIGLFSPRILYIGGQSTSESAVRSYVEPQTGNVGEREHRGGAGQHVGFFSVNATARFRRL